MTRKIIKKRVGPGRTINDGYGQPITNYNSKPMALTEVFAMTGEHLCFRWEDQQLIKSRPDLFGGKK